MITIQYNGQKIENNDMLQLTQVNTKPSYLLQNQIPNKYYTLMMIDIDAPSHDNPIYSPWLHWLIINIQNNSKNELIPYYPPTPPKGSGNHRYIFILYEQQIGQISNNKNITKREKFKLDSFIKSNNLIEKNRIIMNISN